MHAAGSEGARDADGRGDLFDFGARGQVSLDAAHRAVGFDQRRAGRQGQTNRGLRDILARRERELQPRAREADAEKKQQRPDQHESVIAQRAAQTVGVTPRGEAQCPVGDVVHPVGQRVEERNQHDQHVTDHRDDHWIKHDARD